MYKTTQRQVCEKGGGFFETQVKRIANSHPYLDQTNKHSYDDITHSLTILTCWPPLFSGPRWWAPPPQPKEGTKAVTPPKGPHCNRGFKSSAKHSIFCSFWYNPLFISKQSRDLLFKGASDTLFLSPESISTHQYAEITEIGSVCTEN